MIEAMPAKNGTMPAISSKWLWPETVSRPHQPNIKPQMLISAKTIANIFITLAAAEYMMTAIKTPTTEAMPTKNGIELASSLK